MAAWKYKPTSLWYSLREREVRDILEWKIHWARKDQIDSGHKSPRIDPGLCVQEGGERSLVILMDKPGMSQ